MTGNLKLFNILVADSDYQLSKVFQKTLQDMGFSNVTLAGTGQKALEFLQKKSFDLLITEWNLQKLDGLSLVKSVRRNPSSPDPTLPIIMLTGRAEQADVVTARNAGVNEYVVKPFTAKTIFTRLERLVENPRHFIVSTNFVGPDRRSQGHPPTGQPDLRKSKVKPQMKPKATVGEIASIDDPKVWVVDYALTRKLGKGNTLSSIITNDVLHKAQAAIESITGDSLLWIRDDLKVLKDLYQLLKTESEVGNYLKEIADVSLSMSGRAGTFGYISASKVAYLLYLFASNTPQITQPVHLLIIEKHISVLQVSLSNTTGKVGTVDVAVIIGELQQLAKKFTAEAA